MQGFRLLGAIISQDRTLIAIEVAFYMPFIALIISRSWIVRQINYIWQCICLIALIISLLAIALAVALLNLPAEICEMDNFLLNKMQDRCEQEVPF